MRHSQRLYTHDFVTLKRFGKRFKITYHKLPVRQSGYEINKIRIVGVNNEKLKSNIIRAKSKVFEYAYCNEFDYFVTLTIDPRKYDRSDLKGYYKDFTQFLRDYRKKHKVSIQYLFIPELHEDGKSWHMHGLIKGIDEVHLKQFTLDDNIPLKLKKLIKKGQLIYNWEHYAKKFGYVSLGKIRSQEAVCKYITKYINKALANTIKELNAHLYYCSKGLEKAVEIKRGTLSAKSIPWDFENDYVKVAWTLNQAAALSSIDEV